jgi:SAM-dependent methyltransferase
LSFISVDSEVDVQPRFLQGKVIDHFVSASADYAHRRGVVHPAEDPVIVDFVKKIGPGKVLEVGGGSGYMLDLLAGEANATQLYNCELAYQAYREQVNSRIALVGGNALSLPFAESTFDCVIAKNLLHHLVGATRGESKNLAHATVTELIRVVKSRGHIIILEQYHHYRLCAAILFYLTHLLSMAGFQLEALGIRRDVVVSFLTPSEIRALFERPHVEEDEVIVDKTAAIPVALPIRLFPFLGRFGRLLFIKTVY